MKLFTNVLTECSWGCFKKKKKRKKRQDCRASRCFPTSIFHSAPLFPTDKTLHHRLFETVGPPQQEECSEEECFHTGHTEAGTQLVKRVKNLFFLDTNKKRKKHKIQKETTV